MSTTAFQIQPFNQNASPEVFAALNRHANLMRKERLPDDPPVPLDETIQNLKSINFEGPAVFVIIFLALLAFFRNQVRKL